MSSLSVDYWMAVPLYVHFLLVLDGSAAWEVRVQSSFRKTKKNSTTKFNFLLLKKFSDWKKFPVSFLWSTIQKSRKIGLFLCDATQMMKKADTTSLQTEYKPTVKPVFFKILRFEVLECFGIVLCTLQQSATDKKSLTTILQFADGCLWNSSTKH